MSGSKFARYDQTCHGAGDVVSGTWLTKMEVSQGMLPMAANILNWYVIFIIFKVNIPVKNNIDITVSHFLP